MNAQTYYLRRCINFIQHKNCVTIILRIKILTVINPSIYFLSLLIGGQKRSIKIHINKYADNKPLHLCLYAFWTRKKRLTGFYCNASRLLSVCAWNIWVHDLMSYVYTIKMNASELNHFGIFCTIYPKVLNISTEELKNQWLLKWYLPLAGKNLCFESASTAFWRSSAIAFRLLLQSFSVSDAP